MRALLVLLAVTLARAQVSMPPRDAAARTAGTSSISGRITERDTGQPMARAVVTLAGSDRTSQLETGWGQVLNSL
jgi:hypothetical protein